MTRPDFARCPKRTAACPSPSHCPGPCEHGHAWMTAYDWRVTGEAVGDASKAEDKPE